jgi:phosphopantetheine--protein transferase-like protein
MRTSIGIDIEEVVRFRSAKKNPAFLSRIFTRDEISYYKSRGRNAQTLAGIFAAKEAVVKALSQLLHGHRFALSDFQISHDDKSGVPFVAPTYKRKIARLPKEVSINLSISHANNLAVAVAFAQLRKSREKGAGHK